MTFPATHNISVIAPLIFKLILHVKHMHNSNPNPRIKPIYGGNRTTNTYISLQPKAVLFFATS